MSYNIYEVLLYLYICLSILQCFQISAGCISIQSSSQFVNTGISIYLWQQSYKKVSSSYTGQLCLDN